MYQQITITGHLGRDPQTRQTQSGHSVTSFSVATSETWNNEQGERQERTTWFQVSVWGRMGEACQNYLQKGHLVLVTGKMQTPRIYQDGEGNDRVALELRADNVRFLTPRGNGNSEEAPAS